MLLEKVNQLVPRRSVHLSSALSNAYRACLGRPSRSAYQKQYRITLMNPNGSTMGARYKEPCRLVRLPVDLRIAAEDEKRQRLALRKPQVKQLKEEFIDDNFDADDYLNLIKK
ncbi:hypothetical protein M3Y97_00698600 [Aphelenchoides bicaudatus]|nr:hypothetical protein M3Y97_00698600 [Aphelenchoides bicaudatus]